MVIKLQILLRQPWRTAGGVDAVKRILESMGIHPTVSGLASLSADIGPQDFESLFHEQAAEVKPKQAGRRDFGSPGGAVSGALQVPQALREYVESISVAPPHTRLGGTGEDSQG